jgi:hypothetical protein
MKKQCELKWVYWRHETSTRSPSRDGMNNDVRWNEYIVRHEIVTAFSQNRDIQACFEYLQTWWSWLVSILSTLFPKNSRASICMDGHRPRIDKNLRPPYVVPACLWCVFTILHYFDSPAAAGYELSAGGLAGRLRIRIINNREVRTF